MTEHDEIAAMQAELIANYAQRQALFADHYYRHVNSADMRSLRKMVDCLHEMATGQPASESIPAPEATA